MESYKPILGSIFILLGVFGIAEGLPVFAHSDSRPRLQEPSNVDKFVKKAVQTRLSQLGNQDEDVATMVSDAILSESRKNNLDPLLLLAVTYNESKMNLLATGLHGEIGLMQLKPSTARWISRKFHLPWEGAQSLVNPAVNIRIGATYLGYLKSRFHEKKIYFLNAYNMGPKNLNKVVHADLSPKLYSDKVESYYRQFSEGFTTLAANTGVSTGPQGTLMIAKAH